MSDSTMNALNRDYPDIREELALTQIEIELQMLGMAVCRVEEKGLIGLILQGFDLNERLSPLKISIFPLALKSKKTCSWVGALPFNFYARFYVEELPELNEYTTEKDLDDLFFSTYSTHQKSASDLLDFLLNTLRMESGLELRFNSHTNS